MGLGQGYVTNWQPKLRNLFIYDESSSRFVCSASVHRLASADGSMVSTQFNYTDSIHCRGPDKKWTDLSHHAQLSMCTSRDKMSASGMDFSILIECEFVAVVSWKVGWLCFFTQNLHSSDRTTGESVLLVLGLFLPIWDEQVVSSNTECWPDSLTHLCGSRGRWVNDAVYKLRLKVFRKSLNDHELRLRVADCVYAHAFIIHANITFTYAYRKFGYRISENQLIHWYGKIKMISWYL